MRITAQLPAIALLLACLVVPQPAPAADGPSTYRFPRWTLELKGGQFYPALDDYETFYGSDHVRYCAISLAYRLSGWFEAGAELGYMSDKGVGLLPQNAQLGGSVTYILFPIQVFASFRYDTSKNQLFVPYVGVGLLSAYYEQDVEFQPDRRGFSDPGLAARAGIQLSMNRLDPRVVNRADSGLKRTFFFVEAQQLTTEAGGDDLGGTVYMLGLRFEYGGRN